MISRSRRDSVGGSGSRIFTCSPRADAIQRGGGGVVAEFTWFSGGGVMAGFFRDLQLRNQIFTQH